MKSSSAIAKKTYEEAGQFTPEAGWIYLSGESIESRSRHGQLWRNKCIGVNFFTVTREDADEVVISSEAGSSVTLPLRSLLNLRLFWKSIGNNGVYLDITGLRHSTWAALLRGFEFGMQRPLRAVYVEPDDYRMSPRPTQNEIYDLSEKIEGISPLPGFARFRRDSGEGVFAPLLGFEGTRLQHLMSQLEPPGQLVFPIVGVPGFRAEYPFVTYWANRTALRESQAWKKVLFAPADCPFSTLNVIEDLLLHHSSKCLTLAPIGTKPQALAAVICALKNPRNVELVYDHPVRKAERTEGIGRLHVYDLTKVMGLP